MNNTVVCPPNLLQGLFTAGAIDNIDHNTSSTTTTGSFHGTGISLFQHPNEHSGAVDRREHRILTRERTCDTNLSTGSLIKDKDPTVLEHFTILLQGHSCHGKDASHMKRENCTNFISIKQIAQLEAHVRKQNII